MHEARGDPARGCGGGLAHDALEKSRGLFHGIVPPCLWGVVGHGMRKQLAQSLGIIMRQQALERADADMRMREAHQDA